MKPAGRVAIITGAGSGIGREAAHALVDDGYDVVLAGRRRDKLAQTAELSDGNAGRTRVIPTDVRDPSSVRTLFEQTEQAFGRLDLLFNNAGIGAPGAPLDEIEDDQWRAVVETNLNGMFWCTREAFRLMKRQDPRGGRIINNGSISAHAPRPSSIAYTATKHAVTGLTKSTALDGRPYDIACGQIDIGNAATELTHRMEQGVPQAHGAVQPEPTMDAGNVANAVRYMASLPLDANVLFMTVMATKMPFVGRG